MNNPQQDNSAEGSIVSALIEGFEFHPLDWQTEQKKRLHDLVKESIAEDAVEAVIEIPSGYRISYSRDSTAALQLAIDLAHSGKGSLISLVSAHARGAHELEESLAKRESKGAYASREIHERVQRERSKFKDFVLTDASSDGATFYKLEEVEGPLSGRVHEWAERLQIRAEKKGKQDLASPERVAERLRELGRDVLIGVATIVVALLLHGYVSKSEVGEKLDLWAYEKLQGQILPVANAPIAVVNIGSGYDIPNSDGRTDLKKLSWLLIRVLKQKPASVAFDIDFSYMNDSGELLDQDEQILKLAYESTQRGIPTYVSVDTGLSRPPEDWLGQSKYEKLAVHPERPPGGVTGQMLMLSSLKVGSKEVPSMSDRLAESLRDKYFGRHLPSVIATPYGEELNDHGVEGREYFLNTAALDGIKNQTVDVSDGHLPLPIELTNLHGKAVVIGSANVNGDRWLVPGTTDRWEAGLYLHAVGAYTRLMAPLYVFRPWVRFVLNLISSAVVLVTLVAVRLNHVTSYKEVKESKLSFWMTVAVAVLTVTVGIALVRVAGVLWIDFFVVLLLLVNHPRIEHYISHLWKSASHVYLKKRTAR